MQPLVMLKRRNLTSSINGFETSLSKAKTMTTDLTAKLYNGLVQNCGLNQRTFRLQKNMGFSYNSESLWNILDIITHESSNHLYNPAQLKLFSDYYGAIITALKRSNPTIKEAVKAWENAGSFKTVKAYSKTLNDLNYELDRGTRYCFNIKNTSESEESDISEVTFEKFINFVTQPLSKQSTLNPDLKNYKPWYNSAALSLAYYDKEQWLDTKSWNNYFGGQGSMLRFCVSLVVVDGVKIKSSNSKNVLSTLIKDSKLGNPKILGVNVLPLDKCLGSRDPITDPPKISEELEKILNSMDMDAVRRIAIAIDNQTEKKLINPESYFDSGQIQRIDLAINEKKVGFIAARKTYYSIYGTWGVVTYEIENTTQKLAIMWSVPFNYGFYENWFKLAIINTDMQTHKNLLEDMYYNKGITEGKVQKASAGSKIWKKENYILQGIMGTGGSTTLDISIRSH